MPVTATSAAVKAAVSIIKNYFNVKNPEKVELFYRGIQRVRCSQEIITNYQGRKRLVCVHIKRTSKIIASCITEMKIISNLS